MAYKNVFSFHYEICAHVEASYMHMNKLMKEQV